MAGTESIAAGSTAATSERTLLGEQTAGTVIRNVRRVYRRHFLRMLLIFVLPTLPLAVLSIAVSFWFSWAFLPVAFVAWGALSIAVSDICLGNRPSVRRSYSQVLRRRVWVKLLTTALLTTVLVYLGLLPGSAVGGVCAAITQAGDWIVWPFAAASGIWVLVRLAFAPTVVALERRSGRAAVRRSFSLTRGQFWRLLGVLVPIFVIVALLAVALGIGAGSEAAGLALLCLTLLVSPALGIAVVLLYYDLRVRRESYDLDALSEDLMR
jgi:hypothetical protein